MTTKGCQDKCRRCWEHMRLELRDLQRRLNMTAIYVTHDQVEALALSDLIAVMNQGQIVQLGSPGEIYSSPRNGFVADFFGWANRIQFARAALRPRVR